MKKDNLYIDIRQAKDLQPGDRLMDCEFPVIPKCIKEFEHIYKKCHIIIDNGYIRLYSEGYNELCNYIVENMFLKYVF